MLRMSDRDHKKKGNSMFSEVNYRGIPSVYSESVVECFKSRIIQPTIVRRLVVKSDYLIIFILLKPFQRI